MEGETRFGCEINEKILDDWRETINHNETIKKRLEEIIIEDIKKHKKEK